MSSGIYLEDGLKKEDSSIAKILGAIARTSQMISKQLSFRVGKTQRLNPFDEKQAELDIFANDSFAEALLRTGVVESVASEEMDKPLRSEKSQSDLVYSVAMDPLDGSSNITTNNPLGSIFGIWKSELPLRGRDLLASAFVTYGPTLSLTFTNRKRVDQYIEARDGPSAGRFLLAYEGIQLPEKPEVYGFGGTRSTWIPAVADFVASLEDRGMKLRYGGTFIGDYNQVLQRGGIFSYPALKEKPKGKLRLIYETVPVSLITEVAGGASSDGVSSILDLEPKTLKDTSPFYTGNKGLISELEGLINKK